MNILVTGGSSGLGEAIVRRLASDAGNVVWFTYNHSAERAAQLTADLRNAKALHCDFAEVASVEHIAAKIPEFNIDAIINNAYTGHFIDKHFHKADSGDLVSAFVHNVVPTAILTQAAINLFRKKKAGKVITVLSSVLNGTPPIGAAIYAANKAYLKELSRAWLHENARSNIAVHTISPSFMQTPFTAALDERFIDQLAGRQPLLEPSQVAQTVAWIVNRREPISTIDVPVGAEKLTDTDAV